jgi:hypothetical protein
MGCRQSFRVCEKSGSIQLLATADFLWMTERGLSGAAARREAGKMTKSNKRNPIWPYLGILAAMFALSIVAPRGWEPLAAPTSIDDFLREHRPQSRGQSPATIALPLAAKIADRQPDRLAAAGKVAGDNQLSDSRPAENLNADAVLGDSRPSDVVASNRPARLGSQLPDAADGLPQPVYVKPRPVIANRVEPTPLLDADLDRPIARQRAALEAIPQPTEAVPRDIGLPPTTEDRAIGAYPSDDTSAGAVERLPGTSQQPPAQAAEAPSAGPTRAPLGARAIEYPRPEALLAELELLHGDARCAPWAANVERLLAELRGERAAIVRPAALVLDELREHAKRGETLAAGLGELRIEAQLLRAQYSLLRRVEVWERVASVPSRAAEGAGPVRMPMALETLETLTRAQQQGTAWREYLLLAPLRRAAGGASGVSAGERRLLARSALARLNNVQLSRDQRHFLDDRLLADFRVELQRWAAEPVNKEELMADLERYERSGSALDAQRLASDCRWLSWSEEAGSRELSVRLDEHYRNANVRVAVAAAFLNRFLPQPSAMVAAVRDTIAGASVEGQSTTYTQLGLVTIPDTQRLRLGIEAHGLVASDTTAFSGPAAVHNSGESRFTVRKLFIFGPNGLSVFPAQAEAENIRNDMISVETKVDRVPLVGKVVQNFARSEAESKQDEARSEVEVKVAARARYQFDGELQPRLAQASSRFNERVLEPLERLGLDPKALSMSTSDDRAVLRFRLAGPEQLAAHTPRPRAPSDSLVSLQLHQSALNNALEQLDLDGRSFKLPELFEHLAQKLGRSQIDTPDDLPHSVVVTFAAHDALRVSCDDGQVELRISLAELSERRRHWKNFTVRTSYKPDTTSLETRFVRSGGIYLEGESIKGKPQFALRSVFSKVLSSKRPWGLVDPKLAADPRVKDLEITQFTSDKGWIGIAYAPRRQPLPIASRPK